MLTVMLIWLYIIITTYIIGYGFLKFMTGLPGMSYSKEGKQPKPYAFKFKESYIVAGIVIATVYAQIVSLFIGVGIIANVILLIFCALIAYVYRIELFTDAVDMFFTLRSRGNIYIYLAVFLVMAYGTSHGYMHYDSDLYHAQAIHWIEEYGLVKGLGNLHVRFAYNSSSFALSALYSMKFPGGQSYHVMSGFFALLLAWQCVDIKNVARRGYLVISDFARLAAIYYLFTIYDEMVAPASDYFLSTIVFYIIIHWLDMYVKHERSHVPFILLSLLGVYAITIKLSAMPMVILSVIPIYMLFRNRTREKIKAFWISVGLAFGIVIPFLVRNVMISGWLVYPVTLINIFSFDWKIPKGLAAYDAAEIKTFGRGFNDVATYGNVGFSEWVPGWFSQMASINKLMLVMCLVSIVVFAAYLIYFFAEISERGGKRLRKLNKGNVFDIKTRSMLNTADFLTIGTALIACLAFWFFSAPLIRYGVVYVWLTPFVILGRLFIVVFNRFEGKVKEVVIKAVVALFMLWMVYKGVNLILEDSARFNAAYLVKQQDYGSYDTREFKLGDTTFYYPAQGDQIGYYPFPAATHDVSDLVQMRGTSIKYGFKAK